MNVLRNMNKDLKNGIIALVGLFVVLLFLPATWNNDGRRVKKFISRINAHEYNAASAYIYPGDHPKLFLYTQVLSKSPNTYVKVVSKKNRTIEGKEAVVVKFRCVNASNFYKNYMRSVRNLNLTDNTFVDTIYIRKTNDGKSLSFDWANIDSESLTTAKVFIYGTSDVNIMTGASAESEIVGTVSNGEHILIDDYSDNYNWVRCFTVDQQCNIIEGYIAREFTTDVGQKFFSFGVFDSIGILLIGSIILILCIVPFLLYGLIEVFKSNHGGIFLLVGLILGWLFLLYLTIEYLLFELFVINLPYSLASLLESMSK